ncbi:aspartic peptidase domain-containing protein [Lyophyllum atratum]|nr:aspartic peptidase domain-containing protein [Lyophyllum atratum]
MPTWKAKGKTRAVAQEEGPGGTGGVVLPLQVAGGGVYDIAYVIEVSVGIDGQKLSLQVDTGSSDLWITSRSCSSSVCGQTSGHSYDPSGSKSTGVNFNITYLQGNVKGPVVWDQVVVGGYSIDNQALAAADDIANEPLSPMFNGILGLALPLNSIIAQSIPPVTDNSPDGAAWASNLFSITPVSSAPSARFLSLSLSRPGSTAVPAQLGIGRHPSFISDPGKVDYSSLVSERTGTFFWKVGVRAISVWVDGEEKPVNIGRSNSGAVFPSAVLDSGVPLIFTTSQVANGIYGAIGIQPASDGMYLHRLRPMHHTPQPDHHPRRPPAAPLHPLDLTAEPPKDNQAAFCVGLIQAADSVLAQANSGVGDMILGVPFLRNVYTVMAYSPPSQDGSFPSSSSSSSSGPGSGSGTAVPIAPDVHPRLGLLGLTDPTTALDEFKTVRILNQPISPGANNGSPQGGVPPSPGGKKLSVGIIVLIGLLGFFALCLGLFGIRWWLFRRRYRRAGLARGDEKELGGYALAARGSRDLGTGKGKGVGMGMGGGAPDEDVLRTLRYEAYMQDHGLVDLGLGLGRKGSGDGTRERDDPWDPSTALAVGGEGAWGDETLVQGRGREGYVVPVGAHERSLSVGVPLLHEINLEHEHEQEEGEVEPQPSRSVDEFGVRSRDSGLEEEGDGEGGGMRTSMAGVGTAARGGKIGIGVWAPDGPTLGGRGQEGSGESDVVFRRMSAGKR